SRFCMLELSQQLREAVRNLLRNQVVVILLEFAADFRIRSQRINGFALAATIVRLCPCLHTCHCPFPVSPIRGPLPKAPRRTDPLHLVARSCTQTPLAQFSSARHGTFLAALHCSHGLASSLAYYLKYVI